MRDKPKSGMSKKAPKKHSDIKEDKKLVKKMVKKSCIK
jgi:hypothetical protein